MSVLKYKLQNGWKTLYAGVLNRILLKDKNLSDIEDRTKARQNLELTGDNNTTHYHDSHYLPLIQQASNSGTDAAESVRAELADYVKKVGNTILSLYKTGTTSNPANITYDGNKVTIDKPLYMGAGVYPEKIAESALNSYVKIGFFWGTTGTSLSVLPAVIGTSRAFGGINVGGIATESGTAMAQIVWSQSACVCRMKTTSSGAWGAWQQLMTSTMSLDATKLTGTVPLASLPNMTGATASAAGNKGIPAAPAAGKQNSFLRGDNTWSDLPNMTAATASTAGTKGIPAAPGAGKQNSYLRGDNTWVALPDMTGATASAAGTKGFPAVPAAGKQNYFLRGDNTWSDLPNMTGATASNAGSKGIPVAPGAGKQNYFLRGDNTWSDLPNMTGATASAAGTKGLPAVPGAGKQNYFLRGDNTWAMPTDTKIEIITYPDA